MNMDNAATAAGADAAVVKKMADSCLVITGVQPSRHRVSFELVSPADFFTNWFSIHGNTHTRDEALNVWFSEHDFEDDQVRP